MVWSRKEKKCLQKNKSNTLYTSTRGYVIYIYKLYVYYNIIFVVSAIPVVAIYDNITYEYTRILYYPFGIFIRIHNKLVTPYYHIMISET